MSKIDPTGYQDQELKAATDGEHPINVPEPDADNGVPVLHLLAPNPDPSRRNSSKYLTFD